MESSLRQTIHHSSFLVARRPTHAKRSEKAVLQAASNEGRVKRREASNVSRTSDNEQAKQKRARRAPRAYQAKRGERKSESGKEEKNGYLRYAKQRKRHC